MKNIESKVTTLKEHLNEQYGLQGTESRNKFETGFEVFKLGVKLVKLREDISQSQSELAAKVGLSLEQIQAIEEDTASVPIGVIAEVFSIGFGKKILFDFS